LKLDFDDVDISKRKIISQHREIISNHIYNVAPNTGLICQTGIS
jgi:hypothetical protein